MYILCIGMISIPCPSYLILAENIDRQSICIGRIFIARPPTLKNCHQSISQVVHWCTPLVQGSTVLRKSLLHTFIRPSTQDLYLKRQFFDALACLESTFDKPATTPERMVRFCLCGTVLPRGTFLQCQISSL